MWKRTFIIFFALLFIAPVTSEAANKYARPKMKVVPVVSSEQAESNRQDVKKLRRARGRLNGAESDRINVRRARKVDQAVSDIEGQITDMAEQYRGGSVWREAANEDRFKEGSKWSFLKYPLAAPSYVIRFLTWPIAIGADYLNKKGVINKVVNIVSSKDRTFWVYPEFELGFGYGLGAGLGVRHYDLFHRQYEFMASFKIHLNLNQEFSTYLKKDAVFEFAGRPVGFKAVTTYTRDYNAPYYGVGAASEQGARSIYKMDAVKSGGYLSYNLVEKIRLEGHLYFEWNDTSPGRGSGPSVDQTFPLAAIPGFGRSLYYIRYGLSLNRNTTGPGAEPETGGVQEGSLYRYQGLGTSQYDYNEYNVGATQYFRAFMPRHVFVVRNQWSFRQQFSDHVPFYRSAELDVYSPMRGFDLNRFTDSASVVFNLEYRYPVWKFLDGQFFFDAGRVFHGPAGFSFKNFSYDGGGGLRLCTPNYFLARFQLGYGGEGLKILLSTSKEF